MVSHLLSPKYEYTGQMRDGCSTTINFLVITITLGGIEQSIIDLQYDGSVFNLYSQDLNGQHLVDSFPSSFNLVQWVIQVECFTGLIKYAHLEYITWYEDGSAGRHNYTG